MTTFTTPTTILFALVLLFSSFAKGQTLNISHPDANQAPQLTPNVSFSIGLNTFPIHVEENTVGQAIVNHLVEDEVHYIEVIVNMTAADWVAGTTYIYAGTETAALHSLKGIPENGHIPLGSSASMTDILHALEVGDYSNTASYKVPLSDVVSEKTGYFTLQIHTEAFELSNAGEGYLITDAKTAQAVGASSLTGVIKLVYQK